MPICVIIGLINIVYVYIIANSGYKYRNPKSLGARYLGRQEVIEYRYAGLGSGGVVDQMLEAVTIVAQ